MLDEADIQCPYCGETITILVDGSGGDTDYIEDCRICCQPMRIGVQTDAGGTPTQVTATAEDD